MLAAFLQLRTGPAHGFQQRTQPECAWPSRSRGDAYMTTLSDDDIVKEMATGALIKNGDQAQVAGASYELRLGNVYYDLTEGDEPITAPTGGTVLIKPGHRVVLITHEELDIPNDILARVVNKGSLFSVGLSPV